MRFDKATPMLLQLVLIALVSVAASYAFQHTVTAYKINGVCVYRYIAYVFTVFLVYVAFSRYKKYVGFALSLVLCVVALSPFGQEAIQLFPSLAPILALVLGIVTIVAVPSFQGRGYFEFVVMLILPAILAESRITGSSHLLATTESVGYGMLSVIVVCVVGGYFCIRYANLTNLSAREFMANGGNERDVYDVNKRSSLITALVVACASCIAMILMTIAPVLAAVVKSTMLDLSGYILSLAIGAGVLIVVIIHTLRRHYNKRS